MTEGIKYRFAKNNSDEPVDVQSLDPGSIVRGPFTCYGCNQELIAHLGAQRAHHFQHKVNISTCARESYLHKLAKSVFTQEFISRTSARTPFIMELHVPGTCTHFEDSLHFSCSYSEVQRHDLTRWFDNCTIEAGYKGFVADVLLSSSKREDVLFVEFSVTHDCEPEKIASGIRILEIPIRDEDDVAALRGDLLVSGTHSARRAYNLKVRSKRAPMCKGECPNEVGLFIVYKNGKAFLKPISPKAAVNPKLRGEIAHYEIIPPGVRWDDGSSLVQITEIPKRYDDADPSDPATVFERRSVEAHFNGVAIRSCFVCRFHGADGINAAVFCKKHRESCSANTAADCRDYAPVRSKNEYQTLKARNARWAEEHGIEAAFRQIVKRNIPLT